LPRRSFICCVSAPDRGPAPPRRKQNSSESHVALGHSGLEYKIPMTNTLKTTALLAALTALLIVIGDVLGGRGGMLLFFGFAIVLNLGAYWFSGDIALRMAGAREVSPEEAPELHQLVQELATYARLPRPRVAIIDNPSPNAF